MGQCHIRNVRMWFKIYHNALMTHQTPYKGDEWPWQRSVLYFVLLYCGNDWS